MPKLMNHEEILGYILCDHETVSNFAKRAGLTDRQAWFLKETLNGRRFYYQVIPALVKHGYEPKLGGYKIKVKRSVK